MDETLITQRNDHLYLTGAVKVIHPTDDEIASYDFVKTVKQSAPNGKIMWLAGHYVEGDTPNRNGQMWTSDEVAIKSMTAHLMPVTMMHDPSTAVGVIANTKLSLSADLPASIDTVLAIWAHRFPEAAAEIESNNAAGSLMQSMECDAPAYSCSVCNATYVKPVDETQHCEHLQNGEAARTLSDVTFTGTGLIFGTRGADGANPKAHLQILDEVASWSDSRNTAAAVKETATMKIEVEKAEYDSLVAKASRTDAADEAAAAAAEKLTAAEAALKETEGKLTAAEVEAKGAKEASEAAQAKLDAADEEKAQRTLASTRLGELDAELAKALPEKTVVRMKAKAGLLTDEQWKDEVDEISSLLGVKGSGSKAGEVFSEQAMAGFNPQGRTPESTATDMNDLASRTAAMLKDNRTIQKG